MSESKDVCKNCGAWRGLHHFKTLQCPQNGREETRDGHKQQWGESVYEVCEPELDIYKENYELKNEVAAMKKDFASIGAMIVCMGGPLNDNILKYDKKQRAIFSDILAIVRQY